MIVDGDSVTAELVPEMAHGGKEEGNPDLVPRDMGDLVLNLRYPDKGSRQKVY
jgi:hypothetical protein